MCKSTVQKLASHLISTRYAKKFKESKQHSNSSTETHLRIAHKTVNEQLRLRWELISPKKQRDSVSHQRQRTMR